MCTISVEAMMGDNLLKISKKIAYFDKISIVSGEKMCYIMFSLVD